MSLKGQNKEVELYERIHTGLGDGVMLRPAIIANMKRYPECRHILHIYSGVKCIFSDIQGLEIVPIIHPKNIIDADQAAQYRYSLSFLHAKDYNISNTYRLSTPCADYESYNSPFESVAKNKIRLSVTRSFGNYGPAIYKRRWPRIVVDKSVVNYAVATNRKINKSRQEIFCETIGVPFSVDNYNVNFSDEELYISDNVINGSGDVIGIHMRTSTHQRDYKYMIDLVEYVASKVNAVITFDHQWEYTGRRSNIISSVHGIRAKWAIMSKLKMLIGPDSFAIHAMGSLGLDTYGMFGPTDPSCRLTHYKRTAWNGKWKLPILRRGFRLGCGRQYCWYKTCQHRGCLNAMSPKYYWNDAVTKLEGMV